MFVLANIQKNIILTSFLRKKNHGDTPYEAGPPLPCHVDQALARRDIS